MRRRETIFVRRPDLAPPSHLQGGPVAHTGTATIAIIPLGSLEPVREMLEWLARRVSPVIVGSACQEDRRDQGHIRPGQKVVYMADNHHSGWSHRCIDQADRVIFAAAAGCAAIGVDAVIAATRLGREVSLVLVNRADALLPTGAGPWISHLPQSQVVHVRKGDVANYNSSTPMTWPRFRDRILAVGMLSTIQPSTSIYRAMQDALPRLRAPERALAV
jgi:hypothetical protein